MKDCKVFPNPITINSDIIQTIVDTCKTTASKHYHKMTLCNFLRRSLSPLTWVSKDVICHPGLVENVKRFLTNNGIPLN